MKILHFIDSLDYGGAETLLMSYIPLLKDHEHIVVTLNGPNVYDQTNYEYIQLNQKPIKGFFQVVKAVRKIIRNKNIELVHAHSYWTNIISRFATPRNIKLLNHYHFADYDTQIHLTSVKKMIIIDRLVSRNKLVRIAVSEYVGKILNKNFPKAKIKTIPNFINCNIFKNKNVTISNKDFRVVAVGNCNLEKNYSFLLQVFEALKNEDIIIDIYGGGERLEYYREMVKKMALTKVKFCGTEPNVREKMKNYDLFLSTSVSETFGMVILEAMCAKLPLLISDIPSFTEIAHNHAIYFNPQDKDDLIKKLRSYKNNFNGSPGINYVEVLDKYSPTKFLSLLKSEYQNNL